MELDPQIEKKWLEAVEQLGRDVTKKSMGDLLIEIFLVAAHLPLIPVDLREKSGLHIKLQSLRNELNDRERRILIGFKILKEKVSEP